MQRVAAPRSNWSYAILSLHGNFFFGGYLSFSPDSKLLAAATIADITVWNAQTGVLQWGIESLRTP